jgi:hypothetical protein
VERFGYEVAVAVAEGLPETEKNAAAMGIRPPFSKVLTGFSFLVFYNFLLFPLFFCRPNGHADGPSWAVNQSLQLQYAQKKLLVD